MTEQKTKNFRRFTGTVVSNKMVKTVVVKVEEVITDPVYGKKLQRSKKFKADNPQSLYKVGDVVVIEECRPISRDKRYRIIEKIK